MPRVRSVRQVRRVGYVVAVFPDLTETFVTNELAQLRRMGLEVLVLSLHKSKDEIVHPVVYDFGLHHVTHYDVEDFETILRSFKPDLIHAHFATEATAVAEFLASRLGVPFTFTAHGYDVYIQPPKDFRRRANNAAAVITVCEANARHLTSKIGLPRSKLHVIRSGVDTGLFSPLTNALAEENRPWIVSVARVVPVKNPVLLLKASVLLARRGIDFCCTFVGGGGLISEVRYEVSRVGLENIVFFTGPASQTEVLRWLQKASLVALTSLSEGLPVSLIEASACGIAAVATHVGGVSEIVEHGVTGLLVKSGDVEALADSIERLLMNSHERRQFGKAARLKVERKFSLERQGHALVALWESILAHDS